nr:MAG TPA: hypothetical protein [Bacteriophage sp.]
MVLSLISMLSQHRISTRNSITQFLNTRCVYFV